MRVASALVGPCWSLAGEPALSTPPVPQAADDRLVLTAQGFQTSFHIDPSGFHGFPVSIDRDGDELRGTTPSLFEATLRDTGHLAGSMGLSGFNLQASSSGNGALEGAGSLLGRPFEVHLAEGKLRGRVGSCHFDLLQEGAVFQGRDTCALATGAIALHLPPTFHDLSPAEQALAVGLALRQIKPSGTVAAEGLRAASPPPALNTSVPRFTGRPRN